MSRTLASLTFFAVSIRHAAAAGGSEEASDADNDNIKLSYWLGWFWIAFVVAFVGYQIIFHLVRYVRMVACLNNDKQRYFAIPSASFARFKQHLLNAPLWKHRHHREFKLSAAMNVGTLPSRLQTILLLGYFAMNIAYCVYSIDTSQPFEAIARIVRNRFGVLSVVNMIPLFLMAGRNNPFITYCGISFDTFNLMHRWLGRIVVIEAIGHTLAWMVNKVHSQGWASVQKSLTTSSTAISGMVGTAAFLALVIFSPSLFRHAFYELFLHLHIISAIAAIGGLWYHLKDLPQMPQLYAVIAIWVAERSIRAIVMMYRNVGAGGTQIEVETLPGDALRVNMTIARPWTFLPGQHVYLYVPSVGWWTSHPFSLAWSDEDESEIVGEKGMSLADSEVLTRKKTSMSLIIRRRTGFTDKLFKKASASPTGRFTTTAVVEGPYGGETLSSYGTVMLWAAGVGITHQVPHVRHLVAQFANGTTATRRLTLVWVIQSPEHLEWIRPWMTSILSMDKRRDILRILLFVTRPKSTKEIHSPSASVQMYPGKPNVQALIDQEMEHQLGAGCVTVCGTGSLADDVRKAVRARQDVWNVDFREESFSW